MLSGGGDNPWEHSGLLEGDIMVYMDDADSAKNGLTDVMNRWPNATVPFFIGDGFCKATKRAACVVQFIILLR